MGFSSYDTPYDWSRLAPLKAMAAAYPGGMADLSVGSPVDSVPDRIRHALAEASDAHGYPRTLGSPRLRTAIADWLLNCRGVDVREVDADLLPTVGSKEAVALMASLLRLGPGDVVVQPRVSYPTYEIGTQLAGAHVLKVDDVCDVSSWRDVPGVRAIWVNSPCNPTGEVVSAARLASLVAEARRLGAVVLSDECYALLAWDGAAPCVLDPAVCASDAKGVIMLYSLSKQSNLAGYRAAFMAGDRKILERMADYRRQIGQIVPAPVQGAMTEALRDVDDVDVQRARYRGRLARLVEALREAGYAAGMPQGGLYVWVRAVTGDCWRDMETLAARGVVASPGEFYGDRKSLRFTATASDESVDLACARLSSFAGEFPGAAEVIDQA
ncbi:succinyldiaminopimelate transaminase [uncultured Bifidobacterium sp.]|uniref:succinyldiaminopimelate transaminase n=1 Tax=uncultured Bifidobacterium sp. TaxID=165187 RepID=UPI0028DD2811|nr:succinyldiaminopimelate transaminase [uncultured Bifidobacterium sp.]